MPDFDLMKQGGPRWTASDYLDEAFQKLPYAYMFEYSQDYGQISTSINNWIEKIKGGFQDAYRGLYLGTVTGNSYKLPFFSEYNQDIGQSWGSNQGPILDVLKGAAEKVEQVWKAFRPSAGIVYPKMWEGSDEGTYTFAFDLINTVDPDNDIKRNREFLNTLIKQNLHLQQNVLTIFPPCVYEVIVPGVRWSPVAVVARLTVTNKGTLNLDNTGAVVPDAWGVSITMRELVNESRAIFEDAVKTVDGSGKVSTRPGNMSVKILATR